MVAAVLLAGCGIEDGDTKGTSRPDAGTGRSDDAGSGDELDAGDPRDAGEDHDAGDEHDAGFADASSSAVDGGSPPDGGALPAVPDHIDCDGVDAESLWCTAACTTVVRNAGWGERVRVRLQRNPAGHGTDSCPGTGGGNGVASVLWRAPHDGDWVVDNFGSEGTWFRGIADGRCGQDALACLYVRRHSQAIHVREGQPIIVISETPGSSTTNGPLIHQININPLVEHETGDDCRDGADNDADQKADCDDDDCATGPACAGPTCADEILPSLVPLRAEGDLGYEEFTNRFAWCNPYAREKTFAWQAPTTGRFVVDTSHRGVDNSFMGSISVHSEGCDGPPASECRLYDTYDGGFRSTAVAFDAQAGDWRYFRLGGTWDSLCFGRFQERTRYALRVRLAEEESGPRCADRIDNDGDGRIDYDDSECWDI